MPTTSNFGWTTPADTDLVKDGAAAIRTLGNGIDTSFLDLKGGTTDQVLAKNSNTDLDFKWVAADDADAIQKSLIDAEGDLIVGDAADAVQRLAIGSNGNVLTVDTSVDGKIKWAALPASGKVLQVIQATNSTLKAVSSTTYADSNLTATITPSSATSKVLIMVSQPMFTGNTGADNCEAKWQLVRTSTAILENQRFAVIGDRSPTLLNNALMSYMTASYLDSPATTSATTYKTQIAAVSATGSPDVQAQVASLTSVMILMEIGA